MWTNLVLDIILNDCDTPKEVKDAILTLPTNLEKLYLACLERKRDSQPLCDPRIIMVVCAVPRPLREHALRQLLALDTSKGDYSPDNMLSSDAVVQHGVGLITLDKNEQLVLPAHDSVRKFIFSEAARVAIERLMRDQALSACAFSMPVPDSVVKHDEAQSSTWEVEARAHIGRACLIHMKQRGSRSMEFSPSQPQVAIPAPMTSMPSLVHKLSRARLSRALLPRSLEMMSVPANVLSPMHNAPAQRNDFLEYARNYWLDCNQHLSLESETGQLFSQMAMDCNKSGGTPWSTPTSTSSAMIAADVVGMFGSISGAAEYQLERMFVYSVANGHLPLLKLILRQKDLPRSILKGNIREHKNLPALHLACRLGHDNLLFDLARNGDVFATSHMSKTALHYAAETGHLNCVKQIIHISNDREKASNKVKFYVDQEDSESRTALHLAVMNGHEDVALFLVKSKERK